MKISNKAGGANSPSSSVDGKLDVKGKIGADGVKESSKKSVGASALGDSSKVEVSDRAQTLKKARELATPDNSIDEAKVARLQKLIDKGEYSVDASAIADKMVDEHMMLPS
jgi:negative regulator of flagellin synthesis FlgM